VSPASSIGRRRRPAGETPRERGGVRRDRRASAGSGHEHSAARSGQRERRVRAAAARPVLEHVGQGSFSGRAHGGLAPGSRCFDLYVVLRVGDPAEPPAPRKGSTRL
jgi:hypothetical protein